MFGVAVLFLGIGTVSEFVYLTLSGQIHALDNEGKEYVNSTLPAIVASFRDPEDFSEYLHPTYKSKFRNGELEWLMHLYGSLGNLVKIETENIEGGSMGFYLGKEATAGYLVPMLFEKGAALVEITVEKQPDGSMLISNFDIESSSFYSLPPR